MRAVSLAIAVVGLGCSQPEVTIAPAPISSVFSADAGPGLSAESLDGRAPVAREPEPGVLAELLAAAPKHAPTSTDPDGGTLIGTETNLKPDGPSDNGLGPQGLAPKVRGRASSVVESGTVEVQGWPARVAERTARAQVYYPLTTRCRDALGKILPPDAIVLKFRVDEDGNIVPSTISAVAADARYESAANCMRRELSALAFRGPAAYRGLTTSLNATIPSVD